ncbi:hypothetical protein EV212_102261 [Frisingicoccus caecimuris]|jgi:hypothetical protein|uniref:Uncharacterized protein n=1 Tax=Frisingicoccus caecimuris TaxID=1796636 RepID=A0A4R2LI52_9FIRM|nr:hypothetical protein EV212_102261 [Frisingicoccus caecimuris]
MTCGESIGNAGEYIKNLCMKKGFHYMGCAEVVMPENKVSAVGKFSTSLVNRIFYPAFVHAKKFYTTNACIGCGKYLRMSGSGHRIWQKE